jgi:hypothetical protein
MVCLVETKSLARAKWIEVVVMVLAWRQAGGVGKLQTTNVDSITIVQHETNCIIFCYCCA